VLASLSAELRTKTVRRSSRLRLLSRLWANPSVAAAAETSWSFWCRVGRLSLTSDDQGDAGLGGDFKVFFGSAARRV